MGASSEVCGEEHVTALVAAGEDLRIDDAVLLPLDQLSHTISEVLLKRFELNDAVSGIETR